MGVIQGDPLSQLICCLAMEVLRYGITNLVYDGNMRLMNGVINTNIPYHVLYDDNIILFTK